MSLVRLLTAGKTLIGLKRSENRYQLPGGRTLPMFGSKKNPFRATVFPDKAEPTAPAEAEAAPAGPAENQAVESTPHHDDKAADFVGPAAEPLNGSLEPKEQESTNGQTPQRRTSALRALFLWRRVRKSNVPGPVKNRSLVQAELSLDAVKVVRNDLSESDLEIVQANPKRAISEKSGPPAEQSAVTAVDWSQPGQPLLSAVKM